MAFSLSNFYQSCWTSSRGKLEAIQGLSLQQKNRHLQIYWIVTAFQSLKVSIQKKTVFSCYQTTLVSLKPTTYTLNTSVKDSEEVHTGLKLVMFSLELWAMSHPLRGSRWWNVLFFSSVWSHGLTVVFSSLTSAIALTLNFENPLFFFTKCSRRYLST